MSSLTPQAELMRLEYSLGLSRRTSGQLLRYTRRTARDVQKILWECDVQRVLLDDFSETAAFESLEHDQKYRLHQQLMEAEDIYHELSQ